MKHCRVCQVELTEDNWYESNRKSRMYYCNAHYNDRNRNKAKSNRNLVLDTYGPVCSYCGETDRSKLELDHVNANGKAHRLTPTGRKGSNAKAYTDAISRGFPDDYQILCKRCNHMKTNMTEAEFYNHIRKIAAQLEHRAIMRGIKNEQPLLVYETDWIPIGE